MALLKSDMMYLVSRRVCVTPGNKKTLTCYQYHVTDSVRISKLSTEPY
ncbi:predicted protein [Sclerotinia sclerotiorum 1980 UF-70]|uniref:Uncharacterized protein n=1 Tax=Sclerotinia sclerotiorum (strain ATCC 18683 / 1980 / Ss-1) TaxID=665079 RepID=A7EHN7_SCLS1|nr:predicted protein [Sclerotinia sclerotiorum 1980 UF-70]EDO02353.1 predicted protein [Sclerotinia sclerotiorum 1980 UF-70]